jgi:hypothetical protein
MNTLAIETGANRGRGKKTSEPTRRQGGTDTLDSSTRLSIGPLQRRAIQWQRLAVGLVALSVFVLVVDQYDGAPMGVRSHAERQFPGGCPFS